MNLITKEQENADKKMMEAFGSKNSFVMPVLQAANQILAVKEFIKQNYEAVKSLKGLSIGFLTDEKPGESKYTVEQVTNCVVEALANGFRINNNEFNIIGGRMMGVLNGYFRKVREFQNESVELVDLEFMVEDVDAKEKIVKVKCSLKYSFLDKKTDIVIPQPDFKRTIMVTSKGQYDTVDGWIGKANRKILKELWQKLTGQYISDYDWEEKPEVFVPKPGTTLKEVSIPKDKPKKISDPAPAEPEDLKPEEPINLIDEMGEAQGMDDLPFEAPEIGEL